MSAFVTGIAFNNGVTQTTKVDSTTETGNLISSAIYTTAGSYTWTRPSNCKTVLVQVIGAGGGGASYNESGGSGGYCEKVIDVTNISSVSVTVGAGGGAVGYYAAGGNGGTSSFGSHCSATGGFGANRQADHTGGVGGTASGGDLNIRGGSGTGHGNTSGREAVGRGGQGFFGGSRGSSHSTNTANLGGAVPGAGGVGGAMQNYAGSNGNDGAVIVHSYT